VCKIWPALAQCRAVPRRAGCTLAGKPYRCASPSRAVPCHSVLSVKRVPAISDTLCCLEMQFWEVVCSTACTEQHSWVHALSLAGKSSCCL